MSFTKVYTPYEALPMMGITCTHNTADAYIRNMIKDGVLSTSFKRLRLWQITDTDIEFVKEKIIKREYIPSSRHNKKAA